jgi:hypothetical protein
MSFNHTAIPTVVLAEMLFVAGVIAERKAQSRHQARITLLLLGVLAAIPGILVLADYTHVFRSPVWFYEFRTAPYSEISVAGLGFLAGYFYSLIAPEGKGEKLIWPLAVFVLVSIPFIKPILDPINLNALRTSCPDKVCLQTTYSTCGPSSVASILLSLGQEASEQSLAREALTSKGGTELWYLARAVQRRGFSTAYLVNSSTSDQLPAPAVAGVVLTGGTGHFIALVSRSGDQITVVDPLKGRFIVSDAQLKQRYHFSGVFLVIRFQA